MFWAFVIFLLADMTAWFLYRYEKKKSYLAAGIILTVISAAALALTFIFMLIGTYSD